MDLITMLEEIREGLNAKSVTVTMTEEGGMTAKVFFGRLSKKDQTLSYHPEWVHRYSITTESLISDLLTGVIMRGERLPPPPWLVTQ